MTPEYIKQLAWKAPRYVQRQLESDGGERWAPVLLLVNEFSVLVDSMEERDVSHDARALRAKLRQLESTGSLVLEVDIALGLLSTVRTTP